MKSGSVPSAYQSFARANGFVEWGENSMPSVGTESEMPEVIAKTTKILGKKNIDFSHS